MPPPLSSFCPAASAAAVLAALVLLVASVPLLLGRYADGNFAATSGLLSPASIPAAGAVVFVNKHPIPVDSVAVGGNWTPSPLAGGGDGLGPFPLRGTPAFERECGWTLEAPGSVGDAGGSGDCTVLVRPRPKSREGVAEWLSHAVAWYTLALQGGCRLLMDYGEGVNVTRVIEPPLSADGGADNNRGVYDWRVPPGFQCLESRRCVHDRIDVVLPGRWLRSSDLVRLLNRTADGSDSRPSHAAATATATAGGPALADVPAYRFSATRKLLHYGDPGLGPLKRALPRYALESGYACAQANLLRLSKSAAEYEPRLFAEILPAMRDPSVLVLGLYVRTGSVELTDGKDLKETQLYERAALEGGGWNYTAMAGRAVECAEGIERMYLSGEGTENSGSEFSSVIWAFFSDAPDLRSWVERTYSSKPTSADPSISRRILVTSTSSGHTRPINRSPLQSDFAGALIDWILLGETNVIVVDRGETTTSTFGMTGAMRTGRVVYDATRNKVGECVRRNMVWPPEEGRKQKRRKKMKDKDKGR